MKFNKYEQLTLNITVNIVGVILALMFLLTRAILKTLHKSKRWLFRLAIVILLLNSTLTALHQIAYAPEANAYFDAPKSQTQQIVDYVHQRFGKEDGDKFLKILSCENHKLNPNAQNHNSDGSVDTGIGQVNSVHGVPANYLKDWHTNIDISYLIYKDSGWGAWTCYTYYHVFK